MGPMDPREVSQPPSSFKLPVSWLLGAVALVGILPFYTLVISDLPVVWFFCLIISTVLLFLLSDIFLHSPLFPLQVCFFVFVFQNVLIGLFNPGYKNPGAAPLLLGYTALLPLINIGLGLLSGGLFRIRSFWALHLVSALYFLYIAVNFIVSPWPLTARLPAFRNAVSLIVLLYAGYLRPRINRVRFRSYVNSLFVLTLLVLVFGYVERFLLGDDFWVERLNIGLIIQAKHLRPTPRSPYPVPSDFYSPIGPKSYRRMASLFATPITLAYFLSFSFLLLLSRARRGRLLWLTIIASNFVALVLTFSKGGYLIAGIGFLVFAIVKFKRVTRFWPLLVILFCAGVVAVQGGYWLWGDKGTTLSLHLQGLYAPIKSARGGALLVGHFLGSGGTISARLGADIPFDVRRGAESGIGSLFYQTGLVGVLLYLSIVILVLRGLFFAYRRWQRDDPDLADIFLSLLAANAGLLVNVFFQENALALIPASFFLISAGIGLNSMVTATRVDVGASVVLSGKG